MNPDSMAAMVRDGHTDRVEEEWMRLVEAEDLPPKEFGAYANVLRELRQTDRKAVAGTLAWAAVETVSERCDPADALCVAAPFLLAVGESEDLRRQVASLFEAAFADREGLSALMEEAGLRGGRPVRRAVRTLEVCLTIAEGDYLTARDDDGAARVKGIDPSDWTFEIDTGDGTKNLGAVHLADQYQPASSDDFSVMLQFAPDELSDRLWADPAPLVSQLCVRNESKLSRDALEAILVPALIDAGDWKKWWTKARPLLRRCPNLEVEARSPFFVTYVENPVALEDTLLSEASRGHDLLGRLGFVGKYLRECTVRGSKPSPDGLRACCESFSSHGDEMASKVPAQALSWWLAARRIARMADIEPLPCPAVDLFRQATDLRALLADIEDPGLLDAACECVIEAWPDGWTGHLAKLLPILPLQICEKAAARLVQAGLTRDGFEPIVEDILASPVAHFEALLWLWDGPSVAAHVPGPALGTLLSRIIRALDQCRRTDSISKELSRKIGARARAVLSARKYERFNRCLDEIQPGLGRAIRSQMLPLDNLGRSVLFDMVRELDQRFPSLESATEVRPWELEGILWVTQESLSKKQREIEHHVNVKMRENAIAIGNAAQHGDLSENSEYKFALEERDLLRARLAMMNAEMAAAKVLVPEDVPTDHIGVGSRAIFKRAADDAPYDLAIVGPWEADADAHWFNYKAPLSQRVLGMTVGATIDFDHAGAEGTYELIGIENVLAALTNRN